MVKQIGGDRVEAKIFVDPSGDAHVYEPSPGDVKALAKQCTRLSGERTARESPMREP